MNERNIMKAYIKKNSFMIGAILLYCIPFIFSFSVNQAFLLIENYSQLRNVNCANLYIHPSFLFDYVDIIIGLISIIASIFLARPIWDLSINRFLKWTFSIFAFIALFGFSILVPWFQTNVQLHKDRVLINVVKDLSKGDKKVIAIRLKHVKRQINMFGENRDFNIYKIVNVSNDPKLRKIHLPLNYIKILDVSLFGKDKVDIDCQIVIGNVETNKFYLMDMERNILGIDLKVIKFDR